MPNLRHNLLVILVSKTREPPTLEVIKIKDRLNNLTKTQVLTHLTQGCWLNRVFGWRENGRYKTVATRGAEPLQRDLDGERPIEGEPALCKKAKT